MPLAEQTIDQFELSRQKMMARLHDVLSSAQTKVVAPLIADINREWTTNLVITGMSVRQDGLGRVVTDFDIGPANVVLVAPKSSKAVFHIELAALTALTYDAGFRAEVTANGQKLNTSDYFEPAEEVMGNIRQAVKSAKAEGALALQLS